MPVHISNKKKRKNVQKKAPLSPHTHTHTTLFFPLFIFHPFIYANTRRRAGFPHWKHPLSYIYAHSRTVRRKITMPDCEMLLSLSGWCILLSRIYICICIYARCVARGQSNLCNAKIDKLMKRPPPPPPRHPAFWNALHGELIFRARSYIYIYTARGGGSFFFFGFLMFFCREWKFANGAQSIARRASRL